MVIAVSNIKDSGSESVIKRESKTSLESNLLTQDSPSKKLSELESYSDLSNERFKHMDVLASKSSSTRRKRRSWKDKERASKESNDDDRDTITIQPSSVKNILFVKSPRVVVASNEHIGTVLDSNEKFKQTNDRTSKSSITRKMRGSRTNQERASNENTRDKDTLTIQQSSEKNILLFESPRVIKVSDEEFVGIER